MDINSRKRIDLVLVGHFALDEIIIRKPYSKSRSLGGGATYGSLSACNFDPDAKIGIVSRVGTDFEDNFLNVFHDHMVNTEGIRKDSGKTTKYMLDYHDGTRDLRLMSKAPNIQMEDFPHEFINAKAIHMTPIADEFSPEFLEALAAHELTQNTLVGIDVQGMIRAFDAEGNILMKNDTVTRGKIFHMLRTFGERMIFKASDKECIAVTGETDLEKATKMLGETGAYIFTTLGPKGLYFKAPGQDIIHLKAFKPICCEDETGAGDCFMAVLLLQMGQLTPKERNGDALIRIIQKACSYCSKNDG